MNSTYFNRLVISVIFWACAGVLYFLYSLRIPHWDQVLIRFLYFPIFGFLVSLCLATLYQSTIFESKKFRITGVVFLSTFAGFLTAALINPVTFLSLGVELQGRGVDIFMAGLPIFGAAYLAWSCLYLLPAPQSSFSNTERKSKAFFTTAVSVTLNDNKISVPVGSIECVLASGDYVELTTSKKNYLKKSTISAFQDTLDPKFFKRIHRSSIINISYVKDIARAPNGAHIISLLSGRKVRASRSYTSVIQEIMTTLNNNNPS